MKNFFLILITVILCLAIKPFFLHAGKTIPLLETQIQFDSQGNANFKFQSHDQSARQTTNYKIQSALGFYAYALSATPKELRPKFLNETQVMINKKFVGKDPKQIILNNPLIKRPKHDVSGKGFNIIFSQEDKSHALRIKPLDKESESLAPAASFYWFQQLAQTLSKPGKRLTIFAIAGMNKCYREKICDPDDPNNISKAPTYGLDVAADLMEKLTRATK